MTDKTPPDMLNICYLGTLSGDDIDKLDRVLRSIVDLSEEASFYEHELITVAYHDEVGPLHFDFLPMPIILKFNTGIIAWESFEKPLIQQAQGVLLDFGAYRPHLKTTEAHPGTNPILVATTKVFQKPTVYMVHGVEAEIEMELLRSKMKLNESDILMVNEPNDPDSLKKIIKKLIEIVS